MNGSSLVRRPLTILLLLAAFVFAAPAKSETGETGKAQSINDLLDLVEQGISRDQQLQRQRLEQFEQQRDLQSQRLAEARAELKRLEAKSVDFEERHLKNDKRLAEAEVRMNERLGELRELFGVLQQNAAELKGVVKISPISGQYPDRLEFLNNLIKKAGSSSTFPTVEEIQQLWFEMQREIVESGKVLRYKAAITDKDGKAQTAEITRIGTFNLISDGKYLIVDTETGNIVELAEQPSTRYTSSAQAFEAAPPGQVKQIWLDPSRGSILTLLLQSPSLIERIHQGGLVGYIIIGLGILGVLLAIERFITLSIVNRKVRSQMRSQTIKRNNPLGRVMQVYENYRSKDQETLELKLTEAIAQEAPSLQRFIALLKVIFVVAPLLGLLGTVTGMINTFQAITLFGTGDPKLMAGGISQALVTTVLGLTVAIPVVLLHTMASGRARGVAQIIEERAIGMMAERAEAEGHDVAG